MKIQTTTLLLSLATLPLAAQTATHPTTHAPVAHHAVVGCVKVADYSPKIPALPSTAPCPKPLYTLTHIPDTHLDYVSPLVSPELRTELGGEKSTYSLIYVDTLVGTGPLAQPGKFYTVHYTGYLPDGTKFDSSVDRGEPITFPYGKHRVIQGWDTAFEGMRIGGKRRLFIPYQLGYGEAGRPPVIPAKSELIFDVEFIAQGDEAPGPKNTDARPTPPKVAKPAATTTTPPPTTTPTPTPTPKPQQ
jgi:peptidylprolyl isomerase